MMLGDFGADVIKVERPQVGDQARSWGPPFIASESAYFLATNRNKRSLTRNYDQGKGNEILHRLIEQCNREGRFPRELVKTMGELDFLDANLKGYGCAEMNNLEYGLVMQELERGDSGLRSFAGVQ